jgi:CRISPR-associated protein Csm3
MDYLGGHGTRGYGKIKFSNFAVECVAGELSAAKTAELNAVLKEVEKAGEENALQPLQA